MKLCWIFGLITHAFFNFGKLPWFQKFAALSCLVAVKTRGCGFNGEKVVQKDSYEVQGRQFVED